MKMLTALLICAGIAAAQAQVPVSLTQGTNIAAAVSPDGKQIAFDLQGTLWVMPSVGGAAKALTDTTLMARAPSWAVDNKTIVFQGLRDDRWHIWSMHADGTALTQLTKGAQDDRAPQVSPDGRAIAFASDRRGNEDIYVMPLAGGDAQAVTSSPANDGTPAWSPDGKQLAFTSDRGHGATLFLINAGGGQEKAIATDAGLTAPTWQPDGQGLLYVAQNGETSRLRAVSAVGGTASDMTAPLEDVFPFHVGWLSPTTYFYTADGAIKRRDLTGGDTKTIPFTAAQTVVRSSFAGRTDNVADTAPHPVQGLRAPQVSPDGNQIAFGVFGDILIEDIDPEHLRDGKPPHARRLERDEPVDCDPVWAPDGSQLAFVSERNGKADVWLRDLKTNKERQLTHGTDPVALPSWSPDSKRLALYTRSGLDAPTTMRLGIANAFTGDVQDVHTPLESPGRASWSADGKTLALVANDKGIGKFLLISLTGVPDRFVSPTPDRSLPHRDVDGPVWSPDGKTIAYIQDDLVWIIPVVPNGAHAGEITGTPRALTTEAAASPSWTGDSKNLFYVGTDRLKRIDLDGHVTDFQPNLVWNRSVPAGRMVIWAGQLWDGVAQTYRANVDVVIEGNVIAAVEPHHDRPGVTVINASAQTVIPGLIDSHAALAGARATQVGRQLLSYGITAIREPDADPYEAVERREAWAEGARSGPRAFMAGGLYAGPRLDGAGESIVASPHLDLAFARAQALGYDFIATDKTLSRALLKAAVAKAHAFGRPLTTRTLSSAIAYGADSATLQSGSLGRSALGFSYGDVTELAAKSGLALVPVLAAQGGFLLMASRDPGLLNTLQFVKLTHEEDRAALATTVAGAGATAATLQRRIGAMQQSVRQIVTGGGRILAASGTSSIPPGLGYLTELRLYQDAGIAPLQVLKSATVWPAEALGLGKQLGTIEPGKLADLVIVAGDPLNRIPDLANVRGVVADGHYYLIDELLRQP